MAETVAGLHTNDQASEWSQFDFGSSQHDLSQLDSAFQPSTQVPQYHQYSYLDLAPDTHGVLYDRQGHAMLPPNYPNDLDSTDQENKIPLTQDQVAALESSFIAVPKPKTEYKRNLAEKLGLGSGRVNNWFQNRRARAKIQRHPGHQESDASSTGAPSIGPAQPSSMSTTEIPSSSTVFSHEPLSHSLESFSNNLNVTSTDDFSQYLEPTTIQTSSLGLSFDHSNLGNYPMTFNDGTTPGPAWVPDFQDNAMGEQFFPPMANHQATSSWSPHSFRDSHTYATGLDIGAKPPSNPYLVQNNVMGNGALDNTSSQTLDSNASSVGESNNLMTPPTSTPPLPWLSQEFDGRRASDSSELAHNVEGMHLQQAQWGLGLANAPPAPPSGSRVVSAAGIATPDTSPDQTVAGASTPSDNIASRRNRHRPAALHPDKERSVSYAGPMTASPHSRHSSTGLAPPNQVRRIQSQGQNLNSQSFRVHKSATNSAQISPRNLQTYFDKQPLPLTHSHGIQDPHTPVASTTREGLSKPSTSAALANRSPAEYQHEFHVSKPTSTWSPNHVLNMSHGNSSVPDLHSTSSQSHPGLSIQVPNQYHAQLPSYHYPPQSAPPHQTAFFDESPQLQNGRLSPSAWQGQPFTPPETHSIGINSASIRQPAQLPQQSNNSYLPPFAPSYQFPQDNSPLSGYTGSNHFPAFPLGALTGSPASPAELDFKVDVGPEPKLASKFEKFEFQHTFSDKYGQNGEKK